jgi:cytidylate kinase
MTGHGAALAMRGHPATLSVLITAPADVRVRRLATSGMPDEEAADMVRAADDERRKFFHQAYGVEWTDAANYDLCINSARLNGAAAAEAIAGLVLSS